jgi:hypothetical protein
MDDQKITLLAIEAQKYPKGTSQRGKITSRLISQIYLRFGTEFSEGILSDTFQQILESINSIIDNFRPEKYPYFMDWVRERFKREFQQINRELLTDDQMTELAIKAQNCPVNNPNRTLILQVFVSKVYQKYEDLYNDDIGVDAKEHLFRFSLTHIDRYNANYQGENYDQPVPVMGWINYLFHRRFLPEARKRYYNQHRNIQNLDNMDMLKNLETPLLSERVRECLEILPICTETHLKGRPDVNFKEIAIRQLEKMLLTRIAQELKVDYRSMQNFYLKCLRNENLMKFLAECCTN